MGPSGRMPPAMFCQAATVQSLLSVNCGDCEITSLRAPSWKNSLRIMIWLGLWFCGARTPTTCEFPYEFIPFPSFSHFFAVSFIFWWQVMPIGDPLMAKHRTVAGLRIPIRVSTPYGYTVYVYRWFDWRWSFKGMNGALDQNDIPQTDGCLHIQSSCQHIHHIPLLRHCGPQFN
jgi:hypothetical protein